MLFSLSTAKFSRENIDRAVLVVISDINKLFDEMKQLTSPNEFAPSLFLLLRINWILSISIQKWLSFEFLIQNWSVFFYKFVFFFFSNDCSIWKLIVHLRSKWIIRKKTVDIYVDNLATSIIGISTLIQNVIHRSLFGSNSFIHSITSGVT